MDTVSSLGTAASLHQGQHLKGRCIMAHYICQNTACKKPFTSTNVAPRYCSTTCQHFMRRTRIQGVCDNLACSKNISIRPRDLKFKKHYCSAACQFSRTTEQRFWDFVEKTELCWLWIGGDNGRGYGHFWVSAANRIQVLAHRYSYALHYGPISDEIMVLHNCPGGDNR